MAPTVLLTLKGRVRLVTLTWTHIDLSEPMYARLSHSATTVGSYLFIVGGHNGQDYSSEILLFNMGMYLCGQLSENLRANSFSRSSVSLEFETRQTSGLAPLPRGYSTVTLSDGRLILIGGFDGRRTFDDCWLLDLASSSYVVQSAFCWSSESNSYNWLPTDTTSHSSTMEWTTRHQFLLITSGQ